MSHCVCEWFFQKIDFITPPEMAKQKKEMENTSPEAFEQGLNKQFQWPRHGLRPSAAREEEPTM